MGQRKNGQRTQPKKKIDLRAIYAKLRKEFTAADLQKFTVEEEGIPLRQIVAEMEEINRKVKRKKK